MSAAVWHARCTTGGGSLQEWFALPRRHMPARQVLSRRQVLSLVVSGSVRSALSGCGPHRQDRDGGAVIQGSTICGRHRPSRATPPAAGGSPAALSRCSAEAPRA